MQTREDVTRDSNRIILVVLSIMACHFDM